jgi:hypothetical protein
MDHYSSKKRIERFLQNHVNIKRYNYKQMSSNTGKSSVEIFCFPDDATYDRALCVAARNVNNFVEDRVEQLQRQMASVAADVAAMKKALCGDDEGGGKRGREEDTVNMNTTLGYSVSVTNSEVIADEGEDDTDSEVEVGPPKDADGNVLLSNKRGRCTERGFKIQRYSEDGSQLLKTYGQMVQALRDETIGEPVFETGIRKAIADKSMYANARWVALDRSLPDATFQEIEMSSKRQKTGFVAQLNLDQTQVKKVFRDKLSVKLSEGDTLRYMERIFGENRYQMWDDVTVELKNTFTGVLPAARERKHGTKIEQLDAASGKVLRTHTSFRDITREFQVSFQTLKAAINGNTVLRNFKWRQVN